MLSPIFRRPTGIAIRAAIVAGATLSLIAEGTVMHAAEKVDIPELLFQPSVNLVLSVNDVEKSKEFYGDILKLKPMPNLNLPGGFVMTRYQVGTTEIKFLHSDATAKNHTGELDQGIGIRRLTLFFPDEQALASRFESHGRSAPKFAAGPDWRPWRRAIEIDPDGNRVELVIAPANASEDVLNNIELMLTVSDVDTSGKFYRDFVGLQELEPVTVPKTAGGHARGYRHGNTTIRLVSFAKDLPTQSGRWEDAHGIRYIQYIVRDLDAVNEFAKSSGVSIVQPIFPLGKLARIMFIGDPDGVINEFVGLPVPK